MYVYIDIYIYICMEGLDTFVFRSMYIDRFLHMIENDILIYTPYHWQPGVRATIWLADTTVSYRVQPIGTRKLRFELPLLATTQLEQHTPSVTSNLPKDPSKMLCRASLCKSGPRGG